MENSDRVKNRSNDDLARKTIEYVKKEGIAEANRISQEKLRVELKEAVDNLDGLNKKFASVGFGSADKKMYEFKRRTEKENIAHLKNLIKMNMSPEEKENLKKLFPFAKQR